MILRKDDYVLDVDLEATREYSENHTLCDCCWDRNFYVQAKDRFPKLTAFLANLGLAIDRPDEIGCVTDGDIVDYLFVGYTVAGKIMECSKYEIDLFDGGLFLNILISNAYIPHEQTVKNLFSIQVYGIRLPWVLDEPNPEAELSAEQLPKRSLFDKIKSFFSRS